MPKPDGRETFSFCVRSQGVADDPNVAIRSISLRAETIDVEARSIEAVLATEDKVANLDLTRWEIVDEILLMAGAEVPDQIVLFDAHPEKWGDPSASAIRGSGRDLRLQGKMLIGRLFFAADRESDDLWGKYRDGHATDVSIGVHRIKAYRILPRQKQTIDGKTYKAGSRPLYVTTRWRPLEVSTVPWGADQKAKVRSDPLPNGRNAMNPRLRKYLESIGLRAEANEDQAREFQALLSGTRAQVCNLLEGETQSETAGFAARAALKELGVDPDDPTKALVVRSSDEPAKQTASAGQRTDAQAGDGTGDGNAAPDADAIRAEGARQERERVAAIRSMAPPQLDQAVVERAINEGLTVDQATRGFLTAIRDGRTQTVGAAPAIHSRGHDQDVNARSLAAGFLIGQGLDPTKHSMFSRGLPRASDKLTEQDADRGQDLASMSSADLVRECLLADTGRNYRSVGSMLEALRDGAVRSASVSGGTLSYVFGTNVYARLIAGWETVGDTTAGWCDEEDVPNFMAQEDISVEGNAQLERLPRGDTAKHATISDTHETYSIARYAKQFVVDEQDIIDDRLGAIMRMPQEMGEAARQLRPDMVYAMMLENPAMADTGLVFNSTAVTTAGGHANYGTAALATDSLKAGITAMVKQRTRRTATDPGRQLNIRPRFLIIPAALEWTARGLTAAAALAKLFTDAADPWYSTLNLIAQEGLRVVPDDRIGAIGVMDPRTKTVRTGLDTNWFMAMGGNRGLRVAYLRGTGRRPQMRRFTLDRGQWGVGWDINMDIGVRYTEWRTWYYSTGAV